MVVGDKGFVVAKLARSRDAKFDEIAAPEMKIERTQNARDPLRVGGVPIWQGGRCSWGVGCEEPKALVFLAERGNFGLLRCPSDSPTSIRGLPFNLLLLNSLPRVLPPAGEKITLHKRMMKRKSLRKLRAEGSGAPQLTHANAPTQSSSHPSSSRPVALTATAQWNALPWRPLDVSKTDLGDFEDAVFFGLEELDGNAYKLTKSTSTTSYKIESVAVPAEADQGKGKRKREASSGTAPKSSKQPQGGEKGPPTSAEAPPTSTSTWGESSSSTLSSPKIVLNSLLVDSLLALGFTVPTPIQVAAIPATLRERCDLVGAAETGSGKTLAFCLPVLHSLLCDWSTLQQSQQQQLCPYALILSPTRELAMQISSVLREVCGQLRLLHSSLKIEVVTIVGGMSEQKQRRQLSGASGRPVHVLVATPGRLCDMVQDESIRAFSDMSRLRFLIVDEADRIVEEGHFPELHRVFSRIRDHEKIAQSGQVPSEVYARRKEGTFEAGDMGDAELLSLPAPAPAPMPSKADMDACRALSQRLGRNFLTSDDLLTLGGEGDDEGATAWAAEEEEESGREDAADDEDEDALTNLVFDRMPTEEELAEARRNTPAVPYEEDDEGRPWKRGRGAGKRGKAKVTTPAAAAVTPALVVLHRQTLLYSATALRTQVQTEHVSSKKQRKIRGLSGEGVQRLPYHMQQLLSTVALETSRAVRVIDVTGVAQASDARANAAKAVPASTTSLSAPAPAQTGSVALPKGLTQLQVSVPAEDKDLLAYYYLQKHQGRALLFVNSIKTARRVDGLLRALGVNCRAIHAQLQQRQRLRALESFSASPIGVLVATDVAARGLDIAKITTVLHYDVARSPQVYVHRAGRTARANEKGTSLSLVAPEDAVHHGHICDLLGVSALGPLAVDGEEVDILRERVALAKKVCSGFIIVSTPPLPLCGFLIF